MKILVYIYLSISVVGLFFDYNNRKKYRSDSQKIFNCNSTISDTDHQQLFHGILSRVINNNNGNYDNGDNDNNNNNVNNNDNYDNGDNDNNDNKDISCWTTNYYRKHYYTNNRLSYINGINPIIVPTINIQSYWKLYDTHNNFNQQYQIKTQDKIYHLTINNNTDIEWDNVKTDNWNIREKNITNILFNNVNKYVYGKRLRNLIIAEYIGDIKFIKYQLKFKKYGISNFVTFVLIASMISSIFLINKKNNYY